MTRMRRLLTCMLFTIVACLNLTVVENQQFSYLADAFLHGQTYFLAAPSFGHDTAMFQGKYYWPLGPFPAVVLLPGLIIFRFFNLFFFQGYLQIFLVLMVFYLLLRISIRTGYSKDDAAFLAFGFCFASTFMGVLVNSESWYFAQVIAVSLVAAALLEYLGKKRLWLIGALMSLAFTTRISAGLGVIFFLIDAVADNKPLRHKFRAVCALSLPILIGLAGLGFYNYVRFGNWLEQGYALQILEGATARARSYGIVSFVHVPGNLYYFLLAGPLPVTFDGVSQVLKFPYVKANAWGMSIFVTSPYFLYLFRLKYDDRVAKELLLAIAAVASLIFTYYGIGYVQFGYRYSLDFLPFLFFLLIRNYRRENAELSPWFKKIILWTSLTNLYLVLTLLQIELKH